jgi:hypothetical protein
VWSRLCESLLRWYGGGLRRQGNGPAEDGSKQQQRLGVFTVGDILKELEMTMFRQLLALCVVVLHPTIFIQAEEDELKKKGKK